MSDPVIHWQPISQDSLAAAPPALHGLLALDTSMTDAVATALRAPVHVSLAGQGIAPLPEDESRLFPGAPGEGVAREIGLTDGQRFAVAARTIYVSDQLEAHCGQGSLGNAPLGSLLFSGGRAPDYTLREIAQITPQSPMFPLISRFAGPAAGPCWARRTLFRFMGEPLLVTEIILPDLAEIRAQASADTASPDRVAQPPLPRLS